jgi:hypothetical protein
MGGLFRIKIMVSQLNHHIMSVKKFQVKLVCMNNNLGTSFLQRCQNIQTVCIDLAFQSPDLTGLKSRIHDVSRRRIQERWLMRSLTSWKTSGGEITIAK